MLHNLNKNNHKIVTCSKNLPLSSLSHDGQPGQLPKKARGGPINQTHQKEQKHSTIQTHDQIQAQPISGAEASLQQIGKNQQHIKNNGLHGVEPDIPAEIGVPHDHEVEGQKYQKPIEGEAFEGFNGRHQGLYQALDGAELGYDVLAVLDAVEEGVEVTYGGDYPVGVVGGVAAIGLGGDCGCCCGSSCSGSGAGFF